MNVDSKMTFKTFYYGLLHNKHFIVVPSTTYKETIFYSKKYSFEYFLKEFLLPRNKSLMFDYDYVCNYNEDGIDTKKQYIRLTIVSEQNYVVKIDFSKELSDQKDPKNNSSQIAPNYPIEFKSLRDFCAFIDKDKDFSRYSIYTYDYKKTFEDFIKIFKFSEEIQSDLIKSFYVDYSCLREIILYSLGNEYKEIMITFKSNNMLDRVNDLIHHKPSIKTEIKDDRILISSKEEFFSVLSKDSKFEHGNFMEFKNTDTYHGTTDEFLIKYKISDTLRSVVHRNTLAPIIAIWDSNNVCFKILCSTIRRNNLNHDMYCIKNIK